MDGGHSQTRDAIDYTKLTQKTRFLVKFTLMAPPAPAGAKAPARFQLASKAPEASLDAFQH